MREGKEQGNEKTSFFPYPQIVEVEKGRFCIELVCIASIPFHPI